jgi:hypothetical protein
MLMVARRGGTLRESSRKSAEKLRKNCNKTEWLWTLYYKEKRPKATPTLFFPARRDFAKSGRGGYAPPRKAGLRCATQGYVAVWVVFQWT